MFTIIAAFFLQHFFLHSIMVLIYLVQFKQIYEGTLLFVVNLDIYIYICVCNNYVCQKFIFSVGDTKKNSLNFFQIKNYYDEKFSFSWKYYLKRLPTYFLDNLQLTTFYKTVSVNYRVIRYIIYIIILESKRTVVNS